MSNSRHVPFATTAKIRDHCLCLHVQRAARVLARRFDDALRPLNLTNGQFSLMMSLNRPEPASIGSVAQLLAMDRTTLTAAVKPLARRRLVKVAARAEDRRSRLLTLSASGRSLLASAVPIWDRVHVGVEKRLAGGNGLRAKLRALS
jgi:DNA-binding MarR family transcriptional regulator